MMADDIPRCCVCVCSLFSFPVFCTSVEEVTGNDLNETALRARWGQRYSNEKRDSIGIAKQSTQIEFGLCAIANVMAQPNMFEVQCFISFPPFDAL